MNPLKVAIVYFDQFAPLDVFGPMQAMNCCFELLQNGDPDPKKPLFEHLSVCQFKQPDKGEKNNLVVCGSGSMGPGIVCSYNFDNLPEVDVVLIPGGVGTRTLVDDTSFIQELKKLVYKTPIVLSVCTGAALLARTGFLDGKEATTNKIAWDFVTKDKHNQKVNWTCPPRWVGKIDKASRTGYMTSGGVAAGIDMMLALIYELFDDHPDDSIVKNTQNKMEYTWNSDPANDPFAKLCPTC